MYEYRNRTRSLFNNPTNSGPSVYGSRTPGKFLSDLAAGTDSLDIICIGDSNNGSCIAGSWGYVGGMSEALHNRGYPIYGTPVYPVADTGYSAGLGLGTWRGAHVVSPTEGVYLGKSGKLASTGGYAVAASYSIWNHGTNLTSYGGTVSTYSDDWLFVPATVTDASFYYVNYGVALDYDHPLSANGVQSYIRVRYGKVNVAGGKFYLWCADQSSASPNLLIATPTQVSSFGTGAPTFDVTEAIFTATGKGVNASWGGYNAPSGTLFVTGPTLIHSQSVYRKSKGWAVHSRGYYSGGTSTQIAAMQTNTASTALQLYLREIRERQRDAGGSGRVLLFVHSGINDTVGATAWTAAHTAIWSTYQTAWAALGYPASDLAMVSMVGVQRNSVDTASGGAGTLDLVAVRAAAAQMVVGNPSMCVVDVKSLLPYNALVAGDGSGASYYQRFNNVPTTGSDIVVHLSGGPAEVITGTATAVTSTSLQLAVGSPNVDGYLNNSMLKITGGTTGAYQTVRITSYAGSTRTATVAGWIGATPSGTITYSISRQCPTDGYTAVSNLIINQLLASKPVN
jgi:hypothetical protein